MFNSLPTLHLILHEVHESPVQATLSCPLALARRKCASRATSSASGMSIVGARNGRSDQHWDRCPAVERVLKGQKNTGIAVEKLENDEEMMDEPVFHHDIPLKRGNRGSPKIQWIVKITFSMKIVSSIIEQCSSQPKCFPILAVISSKSPLL